MSNSKRFLSAVGCAALAIAVTGCSGLNYTHGVSPASFLLPGLVEQEPLKTQPAAEPETVQEVALLTSADK